MYRATKSLRGWIPASELRSTKLRSCWLVSALLKMSRCRRVRGKASRVARGSGFQTINDVWVLDTFSVATTDKPLGNSKPLFFCEIKGISQGQLSVWAMYILYIWAPQVASRLCSLTWCWGWLCGILANTQSMQEWESALWFKDFRMTGVKWRNLHPLFGN